MKPNKGYAASLDELAARSMLLWEDSDLEIPIANRLLDRAPHVNRIHNVGEVMSEKDFLKCTSYVRGGCGVKIVAKISGNKFIAKVFSESENVATVKIATLILSRLPRESVYIVSDAGVGYIRGGIDK